MRFPRTRPFWLCFLTLPGILKIWCVLAGMSVFSIAAVCCGRGHPARQGLAVAAAGILAAAVAGPFWFTGIIHALPYQSATAFVAWAVHANPFCSATGAVAERVGFYWNDGQWDVMYSRIGVFGAYAPPPIQWYSSAAIYAALGAVLAPVAFLRRGKPTRPSPGLPASSPPASAGPCRGG